MKTLELTDEDLSGLAPVDLAALTAHAARTVNLSPAKWLSGFLQDALAAARTSYAEQATAEIAAKLREVYLLDPSVLADVAAAVEAKRPK